MKVSYRVDPLLAGDPSAIVSFVNKLRRELAECGFGPGPLRIRPVFEGNPLSDGMIQLEMTGR